MIELEIVRQSDKNQLIVRCARAITEIKSVSNQSPVFLSHATYPTVVMVIKAHQNPSPAPLMNDRGKSSWLVGESYKSTRNDTKGKKSYR